MKTFWHGTSTIHLATITSSGLQPSAITGMQTEKRKDGDEHVYLLADTEAGRKYAEGYAIRAAEKFGGAPVVLRVEIDPLIHPVQLEREGRIDQYSISSLPPGCIKEQLPVTEVSIERMVELFEKPRHGRT